MFKNPDRNCSLCPRLKAFIDDARQKYPDHHNGPVPSFGSLDAELLVVGLAPGLHGANRTGRPFTGDFAGDVLYKVLAQYGFLKGTYQSRPDDGVELVNVRITNSVRCVPPQNKVTGSEVKTCGNFLINELSLMKNLKIILTLGSVAHNAVLDVLGYKKAAFKFAHNAIHPLPDHGIKMINSYHTSRYNINTGRLTEAMFADVIENIQKNI